MTDEQAELIFNLYNFEYQRMSTSGQQTIEQLIESLKQ